MKKHRKVLLSWLLIACMMASTISATAAEEVNRNSNVAAVVKTTEKATPSNAETTDDSTSSSGSLIASPSNGIIETKDLVATYSNAAKIIVDDTDTGFSKTGSGWKHSKYREGYYKDGYYSVAGSAGGAGSTAVWETEIDTSGIYDVSVWNPKVSENESTLSDRAPYTIKASDGDTTVKKSYRGAGGEWESLGEYHFTEASGASVTLTLTEEVGAPAVMADAVKFELIESDFVEKEITIDNTDTDGGFTSDGDWGSSTYRKGYYGSNYLSISGTKRGTAIWTPDIVETGFYEVFVQHPTVKDDSSITKQAAYTIHHADGTSVYEKSQNNAGGKMESIGVYRFEEGTSGNVSLTKHADDSSAIMADAVRFVWMREDLEKEIIIVDDDEADLAGAEKDWSASTYRDNYYGSGYHSSAKDRVKNPDNVFATWTPDIQNEGFYKVSVVHPEGNGDGSISKNAPYQINHARGSKTVRINQGLKGNGGVWTELGIYYFNAGSAGTVVLSFDGVDEGQAIMADAVQFERIPDINADNMEFSKSAVSPWEEETCDGTEGENYSTIGKGDNTSRVTYKTPIGAEGGYRLSFHKPAGLDTSDMSTRMEIVIDGTSYYTDLTKLEDGYNAIAFCTLSAGSIHTIEFLRSQDAPVFLDAIRLEYAGYSLHYTDFSDSVRNEWNLEEGWRFENETLKGSKNAAYLSGKSWNNVDADITFSTDLAGNFGMIVSGTKESGWIRFEYDVSDKKFRLLDEKNQELAVSSEVEIIAGQTNVVSLNSSDPNLRFYLNGQFILAYEDNRKDNIGVYSAGATVTILSAGVSKAKDALQGYYKVDLNDRQQTILGLAIEIQSDYISSGNQGIPDDLYNSVPHDLTQEERDRLYDEMLKGFRYMRMAGGLYYRGTDEQGKHLRERWDTQNEELAELISKSGIEGIDFEFWSPTPYFKASEQYREIQKGKNGSTIERYGLKCFDPVNFPKEAANKDEFLQEFADTIVEDMKYLKDNGLPVLQFSIQNEPLWRHDTGYSHCYYNGDMYYETAKKVYPTVKEAFPDMHIHADSLKGQYSDGSKKIIADPELLKYVDGWTHHYMGSDSNVQIDSAKYLNSNKGCDDIPVYNTEFEYLDGKTSDWRCINTAQSIMNWMTFENSPIWHWLHALKPLGNSEAEGYSLGFWRKPGDTSEHSQKYDHIEEGEWDYNYQNWNAVRGFLKHMPWNSVRYTVDEEVVRYDQRIMAYKTPDNRLVIALTNRSQDERFEFNIDTGLNKKFHGYRYTPQGHDEIDLGVVEGQSIQPVLPGFSIEFWIQEPDETTVPAEAVTLDKESVIIPLNGTAKLSASVLPENAANKGVTFVSGDATVAKVSADGTIIPLKVGSTEIVVTALSGSGQIKKVCKVTVTGEVRYHELQVIAEDGGSAAAVGETGNIYQYSEGTKVKLEAVPADGYVFENWTSTAGVFEDATQAVTHYTMPGKAAVVKAIFRKLSPQQYKLDLDVGVGGSAQVVNADLGGLYEEGSRIDLHAEAEEGYEFVRWTASSGKFTNPNASNTTFVMPGEEARIWVEFVKKDSGSDDGGDNDGDDNDGDDNDGDDNDSGDDDGGGDDASDDTGNTDSGWYDTGSTDSGWDDPKWSQDTFGWRYPKADGTWLRSEWAYIRHGDTYRWFFFDDTGYMKDGWVEWNGRWYFLHDVPDGNRGYMVTGWRLIDGKWYYFSYLPENVGVLLTDTTTPDGYWVDSDGVWQEH